LLINKPIVKTTAKMPVIPPTTRARIGTPRQVKK
jgi:hypothetical protein